MPRPPSTFVGRAVSAIKATALAAITLGSMAFRGGVSGWGRRFLSPGSRFDYQAEAGDLWRNSAVAACLRVLRVNFSEPFLEVAEGPEPDADPVAAHPAAELIRRPNGHYTQAALWNATVLSLVVDGNAYWIKVRSPGGRVVQLWWAPHWMVQPIRPADGSSFLSHYEYSVNGRTWRLPPSELVHFRQGLDPHDDTRGLSDLQAAVREICSDNEAAGYSAAILRNAGVPAAVITPADDGGRFQDGDQVEGIREEWRRRFTSEGRGEPLVTDSLKVTRLGFSPKELALGDLPDRFEDRIAALTGVNPMVAGLTSGSSHKTFANYGEARRALYEDTIIPTQASAAEDLTLQLLLRDFEPDDGRRVFRWVYKGVACLRENLNELADRVGRLYHDSEVITRAEARKALGYEVKPEDEGRYFSQAGAHPGTQADADPHAAGDDAATKALTLQVLQQAARAFGVGS